MTLDRSPELGLDLATLWASEFAAEKLGELLALWSLEAAIREYNFVADLAVALDHSRFQPFQSVGADFLVVGSDERLLDQVGEG